MCPNKGNQQISFLLNILEREGKIVFSEIGFRKPISFRNSMRNELVWAPPQSGPKEMFSCVSEDMTCVLHEDITCVLQEPIDCFYCWVRG